MAAHARERPVDFLDRRLPALLDTARTALADYVGCFAGDLAFVQNATTGVNLAARSLDLRAGDEVLSTDLEYDACDLAWEWARRRAGARYVRAPIPLPHDDPREVSDAIFAAATEHTRVVYVSHVTSDTGLVLPVEEIVARARAQGLVTVVDGAHAPAHVPANLAALGADFYSGNAHKWLGAPKGAGFLHVRPAHQDRVDAAIVSWGTAKGAPSRSGSRSRERRTRRHGSRFRTRSAAHSTFPCGCSRSTASRSRLQARTETSSASPSRATRPATRSTGC